MASEEGSKGQASKELGVRLAQAAQKVMQAAEATDDFLETEEIKQADYIDVDIEAYQRNVSRGQERLPSE